jgi:hypothetical protein
MKGKCDPFQRMKVSKVQKSLQLWAKDNNFAFDVPSVAMKARNKKVVTKTFHNAGLVVPCNKRTQLGYRQLIETDGEFLSSHSMLPCSYEGTPPPHTHTHAHTHTHPLAHTLD